MYICGAGHAHPSSIIDNAFLTDLAIGTCDDWIIQRVGIVERRTSLSLDYIRRTKNEQRNQALLHCVDSLTDLAAEAVNMALSRAGIEAQDIGLVIAGGCAPNYLLPSNAAVIAAACGINGHCMDLSSACSSFVSQMHFLRQWRPEQWPDYALLLLPENWTTTVDYRDRNTAVLVGDCVAAVIVSTRHRGHLRVDWSMLDTDPGGWDKVVTSRDGHFTQHGAAVQKFAISRTVEAVQACRQAGELGDAPHWFVGHQANLTMLESVCRRLGVDEQHHWYNIDRFGNCGAAGAPSVLSEHWGAVDPGQALILATVGAGLTWGSLLMRGVGGC